MGYTYYHLHETELYSVAFLQRLWSRGRPDMMPSLLQMALLINENCPVRWGTDEA